VYLKQSQMKNNEQKYYWHVSLIELDSDGIEFVMETLDNEEDANEKGSELSRKYQLNDIDDRYYTVLVQPSTIKDPIEYRNWFNDKKNHND
jgi:hypothetical protein